MKNKKNQSKGAEKKKRTSIFSVRKKNSPKKVTRKEKVEKNPPSTRKGKTKDTPIGRTIKTKDEHLPIEKNKSKDAKEKRWIAVIEKNDQNELAVVRLTTQKQNNTSKLKGYKKGNCKETYYKHFVEVTDNNGNPIKVDGIRFIENGKQYDLTFKQLNEIKETVLKHSKQSSENNKKINKLKKNPRD